MGLLLSFIDGGHGFSGDSFFVKGVDIEPTVSVTDSEDVTVFFIEAQVAGSVIKVNILMFLVGTILVKEHD
jgi:hypothetical protein